MNEADQRKIFSQNLKHLLNEKQLNQNEVAKAINVSAQTFNTWCQAKAIPRMGKIELLAKYFKIQKSDLIEPKQDNYHGLSYEELKEYAEFKNIPYTEIKYYDEPLYCSTPFSEMLESADVENVILSNNLLKNIYNKDNIFLARAVGDSMDEIIPEDSLVIIEKIFPFDFIANGTIVLYQYDNSLSIKEFIKMKDRIILRPHSTNKYHKDNVYTFESMKETDAPRPNIIGKVKKVIFDL